jgi:streptomycin 6-kinase
VRVPEDLATEVARYGGAAGRAWLDDVPRLVAEVAERWSLDIGEPFQPSGMTSVAMPVARDGGGRYVLKLRFPEPGEPLAEGAALRHYGGGAAVQLVAEDLGRHALLLERCDPGTPLLTQPDDFATTVIAGLLAELWSPPPPGHPYITMAAMGQRWIETIGACTTLRKPLRDKTLGLLHDVTNDPGRDVVLHSDLHAGNVLRAARRPWLAIDPKGLAGEREVDCAPVLQDRVTPERAPRRMAIVTELLGVDPVRVQAWALGRAVEGAVWCYRVGDIAGGDALLAQAEVIAVLRH